MWLNTSVLQQKNASLQRTLVWLYRSIVAIWQSSIWLWREHHSNMCFTHGDRHTAGKSWAAQRVNSTLYTHASDDVCLLLMRLHRFLLSAPGDTHGSQRQRNLTNIYTRTQRWNDFSHVMRDRDDIRHSCMSCPEQKVIKQTAESCYWPITIKNDIHLIKHTDSVWWISAHCC